MVLGFFVYFFPMDRDGGKMRKFTTLIAAERVGGHGCFLIIYDPHSLGNNEINCDNTCKPDASINGWTSFSK